MTTFTAPIVVNDKFSGVVAADITLPHIQEKVAQIAQGIYSGHAQVHVVSQRQLLVASSSHPEKLAQNINAVDSTLAGIAGQQGLIKTEETWYYVLNVTMNNIEIPWTIIVSVPQQEILAPALKLRSSLEERRNVPLEQLSVAGGVIAFLGVCSDADAHTVRDQSNSHNCTAHG